MQAINITHTPRTYYKSITKTAFITKSMTSLCWLFCLFFVAVCMSGCGKMTGLDFEKFDELVRQDAKKPKHKQKVSFKKIRDNHIGNKPRKKVKTQWKPKTREVDLREFTFTSSYANPTTNEENEMLLNPLSQAGSFTLPQGLSPYYADVIEDEMLPFPLEQKKPRKYQPTSPSELVSLVQNQSIKLSQIDTSKIKDMGYLFACNEAFLSCREDFRGIEDWDTSRVVDMQSMFEGNEFFNADISDWNVSKVRNISKMFHNAKKFNKTLSSWGNKLRRNIQKDLVFVGTKLESNPPKWYRR